MNSMAKPRVNCKLKFKPESFVQAFKSPNNVDFFPRDSSSNKNVFMDLRIVQRLETLTKLQ